MIVGWIIVGIMAAMSVFLISGRGGWMVAGYNTMEKEEKMKYDEKKVCRSAGISLLIVDILFIVLLIVIQTDFGKRHILGVSLIAAFIIIVFAITSCILTEKNKEKYYKNEYGSFKRNG